MAKVIEDIGTLKINLLSQAQYDAEKAGGRLADDELYLTPSSGTGVSDVEVNGESVVSGGVAEIELKTINQNSIVGSGDIEIQGGGASAFVAEYNVTSYSDVKDAYDDDSIILCSMTDSNDNILLQLLDFNGVRQEFSFGVPQGSGWNYAVLSNSDGWGSGVINFASTDTVTQLRDGLMTALDKQKLDGIASGAEVNVQSNWSQSDSTADDYIKNKPTIPTITDTYSGTSSNGMSGKAVKSAIDALDGTISGSAGAGKTLTAFSQTDGKVSATFGNISITKSQVSDFPTIPTVNNATLTIQKNGTTVNTFTANASSNVTANITVPTDTGDLTNGAGFITTETDPTVPSWAKQVSKPSYTASEVGALPDSTTIPSKTSDLLNDSGFITGVTSTSTPTASTIAEFDSSAHMNSTDMSAQDVSDFVDDLDYGYSSHTVEAKTLLWTNPSPNVAFTAQDVTVSGAWDTYDYIEVEYKDNNAYDSDTGGKIIERTPCHATTTATFVNWVSTSSRWEIWHRARWWNGAHTAIHFDSGYWNALSTASGTGQSDNNLIPYKIYGIKLVTI